MRPKARDVLTSSRLAAQKQADTRAELLVGVTLTALGVRYRKNVRKLPGSPDFANVSRRWAVFVNGCFWHHHRHCKRGTIPKNNRAFWQSKFATNRARDAKAIRDLRRRGFKVTIVWECQSRDAARKLRKILEPRRVETR
jgi:DNA mismatch endonuclease, patch repair protein